MREEMESASEGEEERADAAAHGGPRLSNSRLR